MITFLSGEIWIFLPDFIGTGWALCAGVVVGGLIGATSIGCGVLIVPLLMIPFGLEARRTVGSSTLGGCIAGQ